jgi:hypothetical protein
MVLSYEVSIQVWSEDVGGGGGGKTDAMTNIYIDKRQHRR